MTIYELASGRLGMRLSQYHRYLARAKTNLQLLMHSPGILACQAMSHDIDLRNVIYRHYYEYWRRGVSEESEL